MGWKRFFRRRQWDEERALELDAYIEQETADNIARGMSPGLARRCAQKKLGNVTVIREEIYRMNSLVLIETIFQDARRGVRGFLKTPGATLVALLSLALGIGATTAIFSVIYGVLISPYPYAKANEIWAPQILDLKNPDRVRMFHHMREYVELKKLPAFADAMATLPENRLLSGDHAPENFEARSVTANAFEFLGVSPVLGRTIQPSDIKPDGTAEPVIVLSYKAWQRLFNASPSALGQQLLLNDQPFTVIGVMPSRFGWWTNDGGWLVLPEDRRDNRTVAAIVRLNKGVSQKRAEDQLQALHLQLAKERPDDFPKTGFTTVLKNYMDMTAASGEMESSLRLLFGAVGFLLLIACANVANLQLARGAARAHEIAVRISIGAGRVRLFRQLLTESVVLSVLGGVFGVLLALAITKLIVVLIPDSYVPNEARISVNGYVLLFSAAVSVLTGILFGLAPALKFSRSDVVVTLKEAGRNLSTAAAGAGTRKALVVAEIALSVVLLMGASLTIRGFLKLLNLDLGFHPDRVLMVRLPLQPKRYPTYEQRVAFTERVLTVVGNLPGVRAVAIGNGGLPFGGPETTYSIEGQPKVESRTLMLGLISSDYTQTMGIQLRSGRTFTRGEVVQAQPVALINEAAAKLWPAGMSPLGAHVHLDFLEKPSGQLLPPPTSTPMVTIVGIIANTRNAGLKSPPAPSAYIPYTLLAPPMRMLAIQTQTPPMSLLNAVRERLRTIDKDQPLSRPMTLEDVVGLETVQPRFNMALFTFFGMLGLALAAAGIYSMVSYTVTTRTHEIGIRMAIGAGRRDVLALILASGGRLVLIGLGLGVAASWTLGRYLRSEVFEVPETDALALGGVVIVLSLVALLACLLPAQRASRLDPVSALRHE